MNTYHIHITGQVQGVGFRPYVYVMAIRFGLKGRVKNTIDGVHIVFNSDQSQADTFYLAILSQAPVLSIITAHSMEKTAFREFTTFEIDHSEDEGTANLLITPDFALCPDCFAELNDPENRRFGYPFITCTNCGPRLSIIKGLPYDRPLTTMDNFQMCPDCKREYTDPENRRYFSQTNSCPECPVSLTIKIKDSGGDYKVLNFIDQIDQITAIKGFLQEGKIIALKGIGGFLLVCDATNASAIETLRERKHRPTKAFAVMYPDIVTVQRDFSIGKDALKLMTGPVSPIVLLRPKTDKKPDICTELIAPGLRRVGVMIPYTPLFVQLIQSFGRPVIATSGNLSGSPIVFENHLAEEYLGKIADAIVENDRDIVIPQDDSVVQYSDKCGRKIILRRSRGLAPNFVDGELQLPDEQILAVGAELKSTFSHLFNRILYISQYLGDQETYETKRVFEQNIRHCRQLFGSKPEKVLHDLHPGYLSTQFAHEIAKRESIPLFAIQHHEAHFAAVLGEHKLFDKSVPVLGVIWDGVGYGTDGHVWGGEFFGFNEGKMGRLWHFPYFNFLLGDKMPREPRISVLAIAGDEPELMNVIRNKFSNTEWAIYQKLVREENGLKCSSVGRFFDAAASLIHGIDRQSYEGEAAMLLESIGAKAYLSGTYQPENYLDGIPNGTNRLLSLILLKVWKELVDGKASEEVALSFHYTLVKLIEKTAIDLDYKYLAFSGGVFQNALLVDLITDELGSNYNLYFHEKLSPNDECISFGQIMHHIHIQV